MFQLIQKPTLAVILLTILAGVSTELTAELCEQRLFDFYAINTDAEGRKCWGVVTAVICWGRCFSAEVSVQYCLFLPTAREDEYLTPEQRSVLKLFLDMAIAHIPDWRFPYKINQHSVCMHKRKSKRLAVLEHCDPGADPGLRIYQYTEAESCECQKCRSSVASCEGHGYSL
ncbi:gpb5 [Cordylochernes scorpioides]|uniref:Gpb5 n=1 Tax=Cordylochernes scorpioides TaxID=51811 RepID=A0ABY6LPF8_9ARAC|nr:gpb5 [Cordylochernes scorpioides]